MKVATRKPGVVTYRGRIYVVGGMGKEKDLNFVQIFNPVTEEWEDNDMDWENTETERINSMMVVFKKNKFQISNVKVSHLNKEFLIMGKFNRNKIEINIKLTNG